MDNSRQKAKAFLQTLFPCGEYAHLSTHTRSFFNGMIGDVPMDLAYTEKNLTDSHKKMADVLRVLADEIGRPEKSEPEDFGF